jgi:hypothetical protein
MAAKGRQRAALFSWKRSAESTSMKSCALQKRCRSMASGASRRSAYIANAQISHPAASHIVTLIASASAQGQGEE